VTPADVLLRLVSVGAALWVEGDRLRFRAPPGALDDALKADATRCRGAIIALVRSGAVLPATRAAWDADSTHDFEERAGILTYDAGLDPVVAEREAERLVRLAHTRAFVGRAALLSSEPPASAPSVVTPVAAAVATGTSGNGPHRRP